MIRTNDRAAGWAAMLLAVSAAGCHPVTATATYPKCEVPVLLSNVDRIGGGKSEITSSTYELQAETGFPDASTQYGKKTMAGPDTGPLGLTFEAVRQLADQDAIKTTQFKVDRVWTGDFFLAWTIGIYFFVHADRWADPKGHKVQVR